MPFFDNFKETPLTYRIVVQFILILMKRMSEGAVLDDYFDDRADLQTEPGNTDFIPTRSRMKLLQQIWSRDFRSGLPL